jgi:hypothetical protein
MENWKIGEYGEYGEWRIENGQIGELRIRVRELEKRELENWRIGEWRMENEEWSMENGEWRSETPSSTLFSFY